MEINFSNAEKVIYNNKEATCIYVGNELVWSATADSTPDLNLRYTTFTAGPGTLIISKASSGITDLDDIEELYIDNVKQENPNVAGLEFNFSSDTQIKIRGNFTLKYSENINIKNIVIQNDLTSCWEMFQNCTNLVEAPVIPSGVTDCSYMFEGCTSLIEAPVIPAGVTNCLGMFLNCTSLVKAPVIPEGVISCFNMFNNCALVEAPIIPDGVVICENMFFGCKNLLKSPVIPSSVKNCARMFCNCTGLVEASSIQYGIVNCNQMFKNCSSLVEAPIIPSSVEDCSYMFEDCTSLTTIPPENVELMNNPPETLTAADYYRCYYGCINIVNPITYDQIAYNWT